jgi:hypothetical protein
VECKGSRDGAGPGCPEVELEELPAGLILLHVVVFFHGVFFHIVFLHLVLLGFLGLLVFLHFVLLHLVILRLVLFHIVVLHVVLLHRIAGLRKCREGYCQETHSHQSANRLLHKLSSVGDGNCGGTPQPPK